MADPYSIDEKGRTKQERWRARNKRKYREWRRHYMRYYRRIRVLKLIEEGKATARQRRWLQRQLVEDDVQ